MNWKKVSVDGKIYLTKCIIEGETLVQFYLSDFQRVWKELCTIELVLARAREQNKRIEYDNETILSTLADLPAQVSFRLSTGISELDYKYYVSNRPFNFTWKLLACDQDEFMETITKPLLLSVSSLAKQNAELIEIINKKDVEIEQYKLEGASLKRYKLVTEKFNPDAYQLNVRFKPVPEFVTYADEQFEDFLKSNTACESTSNTFKAMHQQKPTGQLNKTRHSPRSKKNSAYRSHIQQIQQKLDMNTQKVHYDDSDSSTPSAISDNEMKIHQNKREVDQHAIVSSINSSPSKKLKLSRKKLDL